MIKTAAVQKGQESVGAAQLAAKERADAATSQGNAMVRRLEQYAAFRVLESMVLGFRKDRLTSHAAAMTYYALFALFPLILLFMSLAGLALQSNESAREQILGLVIGLLPQGQEQLRQVIAGVIDAKGVAAGVGILTLLWSALGWFQVIDNNVNQIWGVDKPRSFIKSKLFALAMVAAIGGVATLSWAATVAVGILASFTGMLPGAAYLWQLAISAVGVLTMAGAFLILYRYTPRRRIDLADAWLAALTTAIIWELTRRALALYLERNNMISGYGPIGAAMALVFWLYVACIILLLGAELTYAIAKERRGIGPREEMQVVAPEGEQPTPKFAPQVGAGFADRDTREPIMARPSTATENSPTPTSIGSSRHGNAHPVTGVGHPAMGVTRTAMAIRGLVIAVARLVETICPVTAIALPLRTVRSRS
jgi:membrane protein